ncbi:MAG: DUF1640 domain-containing protein [Magnetococcales bacterium]|nr:DUF1640 domain-containing protein [Magnetococcales bacterium]
MTTITFDTLALAKELEAVGFPQPQAEAQVRVFAKALGQIEENRRQDLATKGDIDALRSEMHREISDAKADIIKWIAGLLIAQTGVAVALVKMIGG